MAAHDQCPSSKKSGKPGKRALAREARDLPRLNGAAGGRKLWRSVEEYADTGEFREFVEREFPAGASELVETSRRSFLQLMGASMALAGAAVVPGCRRPVHNIMPYSSVVPEEVIPGKPLFYATSMPLPGGGAEGLLVETHEGRPTKVEGNPLHPINQGKSSIWSQASILGLYDPDRLVTPRQKVPEPENPYRSWDDFALWAKGHFAKFDAGHGAGLAFLVEKKTSPSREAMRDQVRKRWPQARWVAYDAAEATAPMAGTALATGTPCRPLFDLKKAKVIVSLDSDFLDGCRGEGGAGLVYARDFAFTRRVLAAKDEMSRLYVAESGYSTTGGAADHRLALPPSRIAALAVELAKAVLARSGGAAPALAAAVNAVEVPDAASLDRAWIDAAAEDLVSADDGHGHRVTRAGETLIVAGPSQAPQVHALAAALNEALGNVGKTVRYVPVSEDEAADSAAGIADLTREMAAGHVTTLVVIGCNPLYDAPADVDFASAYARVASICLSVDSNETAEASTWELNGAHFLEAWGDTRAADGTCAPVQPMIAPLYDGRSDLELLAMVLGEKADGHEIVRETWRAASKGGDFEKFWKRSLHDGVFAEAKADPASLKVDVGAAAGSLGGFSPAGAPTDASLDVVFQPGNLYDGRFANYGWLQELPQTGTRVVWDNPAVMSPRTAAALKLQPVGFSEEDPSAVYTDPKYPESRLATITVAGRSMQVPVWILPGMPDHTVILTLGYGRTVCGKVGSGAGFNTYRLRDAASRATARAASVAPASGTYMVASTQMHWSVSGRTALVRLVDLPAWKKHGDDPALEVEDPLYKTKKVLSFGERVDHGELTHTPPNLNLYADPLAQAKPNPADSDSLSGRKLKPDPGSPFSERPQWAMSIDLATCTGCGTCTIACQAENNIPIVGKKEVAKGREMTWIRVDRYFAGDILAPTEMMHQPVTCMQCENAPCETVCPVNATVHGPEGLNYMTYNRCIGTRYCANNCPYKVRRFNFFDYGVTAFKGKYYGEEQVPYFGRRNPNLVPPRLREKLREIEKMRMNPDVTVRSRGVMEKCTYCVQRINAARVEMKLHDLQNIPDGFFQTACQQACPTGSIVFGDHLDTASRVHAMREHTRTYAMLGYLNTRPRTTYMVGVKNPNRKLLEARGDRRRIDEMDNPFGDHGHGGGGDSHEGGGHAPAGSGHSDAGRRSFLRDSVKSAADKGYALSLRVLGVPGVRA